VRVLRATIPEREDRNRDRESDQFKTSINC
jgi:hypothetical protein